MPLQTINYSFYATGADGITHYRVYAKNGTNFVGTGVPDSDYLIALLDKSNRNLSYEPKQTGDYFFRIYSYNADARKLSNGYASGYTTVTGSATAEDYKISTLRLARQGKNSSNQAVKSGFVNDLNPDFTWQVGNHDPELLKDNTEFRITTRPVSTSSTPDSTIYYELTGYRTNISKPRYIYDIKQNIAASGGPYRNYDLVVEMHKRDGTTSAGNIITGPRTATESWSHANGYDKITIFNEKPTGIWLTTGDETYNGYQTKQWVDGERNLHIEFTSGELPADIIGARVFHSTNSFEPSGYIDPTGGIITSGIGQIDVYSSDVLFENIQNFNLTKHMVVPTYIENTGFVSATFFDTYELNMYENNIARIPVDQLSPVREVYSTGSYHKLSIFNNLSLHNTGDADQYAEFQYRSPIGGSGFHTVYMKDKDGDDIIISTFT
ncbi:MAG: hypothetical protein ISP56_06545 [Flavobacteriaceae bacterium]|nr:hypothetical protein [Flavobacteriaceae bacterium]